MTVAELDRVSALLRAYLFEDLSPAEVEPLARSSTVRRAVRGEHIWHVGDSADQICVVVSGQLKDSIVTVDGDEVVHSVYGPGMVIGEAGFFAPERNRVMAMVALEATTILLLRREHLLPFLIRHPQVTLRLLEGLSSMARGQTEIIAALARRPLPERLLLRLLDLAETNATPDGTPVTPRVSQTTLGAMVGASRENVNRALANLAAQGSIRLERGRYVLSDPDRLRREIGGGWPVLGKLNRRSEEP